MLEEGLLGEKKQEGFGRGRVEVDAVRRVKKEKEYQVAFFGP